MVTKEKITPILQNPANITLADSAILSKIIEKYPYFQAVKAIQLKILKNQDSPLYNQKLKTTAAYTIDRSVLFEFIISENFTTQFFLEKETVQEEQKNSQIKISASEDIKLTKEEAEKINDPKLFEAKILGNHATKEANKQINLESKDFEPSVALNINAPLNFNHAEKHSFSEWLKLTTIQPINRKTEESDIKEHNNKTKLIESPLIDSFLKNNPKIKPVKKNVPPANLASQNREVPEALMTETLAKVYLAQNNYKKAIQAYKILSLKNPEKSGLFADQIRAIEKLLQNKEKK